jgi:RNA polymerase sigma factor (sigma-70 family)
MATAPTHPVIRYVRRLAESRVAADLSDCELLGRFIGQRDEAAFAALVRRYGPLVLGVSRRVLHDGHAAEDVLQATFLLLARRAGSIRRRDALGPWLHSVAFRTALKAKTEAARRRGCERRAAAAPAAEDPDGLVWRDLRPVLDEAVASLPERYRVPVVLCYLEGRTVSEVARQLGSPRGTVAANLARGRQRLRARLTRQGLALSAAFLGAVLSQRAARASPLAGRTLDTVVAVAVGNAGGAVAPAGVVVLTKGVVKAMSMTTLKVAGALLLAGALAVGVTEGLYRAWASGTGQVAAPVKPDGTPQGTARGSPPYVIEPPDILVVRGIDAVTGAGPSLDGEHLVRPDGTMGLGVYGSVPVTGLTTEQAAEAIARRLHEAGAAGRLGAEEVRRKLKVEVTAYNSKFYYLITDLAGQGDQVYRLPITGADTVLDAIAQVDPGPAVGGGYRVWVERPPPEGGTPAQVLTVDWKGMIQGGETRTNYVVLPGDRVHLQAEGNVQGAAEGEVDRRLRSAFGDDCREALGAAIKLELRSRRVVLAADRFSVEADGRVKLTPCWLVQSGQEEGGAGVSEGLALRCREAFLTFDGPVHSLADVGRRQVTAVEPAGDVRITFPAGGRKGGGSAPAGKE